jgi:hypothetical protein
MRADLSATRADTAYIKGRLEGLPTMWQIVGTVVPGNIALAGLLAAAMKLISH